MNDTAKLLWLGSLKACSDCEAYTDEMMDRREESESND